MDRLFVGIDVGSRNNAVYIMLPDGSKYSSFGVQNNLGGARTISQRVVSALAGKGLSAVTIGIEATSVYGDNLMCFLREDGTLCRFDRKLFVLNPKQVNKFKASYSDLPKNDPVDAFVIADSLRFGRIGSPIYMDEPIQSLANPYPCPFLCRPKPNTRETAVYELSIYEMLRSRPRENILR